MRHQSGQRQKDSHLDCRLRFGQLRHGCHHGRAGARHARLRIRYQIQFAHYSSRSAIRPKNRLARLCWGRRVGEFHRTGDFTQRFADGRSQKENHRLARSQRPRQKDGQLQIARLAVQPATLLGRAVPDCLEARYCRESLSRSPDRISAAGLATVAHRLQTHGHRRTTARPREGLGEPVRRFHSGNEHDAAMGRQLLVLSALSRLKKFRGVCRPGSRAILDGNREGRRVAVPKFRDADTASLPGF